MCWRKKVKSDFSRLDECFRQEGVKLLQFRLNPATLSDSPPHLAQCNLGLKIDKFKEEGGLGGVVCKLVDVNFRNFMQVKLFWLMQVQGFR